MNTLFQYVSTGASLGFIGGAGLALATIPIKPGGQNNVPDKKALARAILIAGIFSAAAGGVLGGLSFYTKGYVAAGTALGIAVGCSLNESYYSVDNVARRVIGCGIVGATLGYAASLL